MSLVVLATTLATQIYIFFYLANNIAVIFRSLSLMGFVVGFLVYGSILNRIPLRKSVIFFVASFVALIPVCFSQLYYSLHFY